MPDKYKAVWISHSSLSDYIKCPQLYYLHNVFKDPNTGRKMSLVSPHMSLGIAVHEVLEGLGDFSAEERLNKKDLLTWYDESFDKVRGEKGGFLSKEQEGEFYARGKKMIENVKENPRFLVNKRIRLPRNEMNPNFYLSEDDNIILNGLIDWIEYLPDTDTLHIVDFKTGKREESESSLQLPMYLLLCNALQKRNVSKASYWYLETDTLVEKELPDKDEAHRAVLDQARKVKEAREKKEFFCQRGEEGCLHCLPYIKFMKGDNSYKNVGVGGFNQTLFIKV